MSLNLKIFVDNADFTLEPIKLQSIYDNLLANMSETTVLLSDLDDDSGSQNISALLTTRQDDFISLVGYNLSFARFQFRGYSSEYQDVFINGIRMNQALTNRPDGQSGEDLMMLLVIKRLFKG